MEAWKKVQESIKVLMLAYSFGALLGIVFNLLRLFGRIKIIHPERFPRWQEKLVLIANHPSYLETFLLPALFFRQYYIHPIKFIPWSTPKATYYDKWFFVPFRPRSIRVEEGNRKMEIQALRNMIKVLKEGYGEIIFPEGRRTRKATDTDKDNKDIILRKGKAIRVLKPGVARLVLVEGVTVLFIWIDGAEKMMPPGSYFPRLWKKMTIKLGNPMKFQGYKRSQSQEVMQIIINNILDLGIE